jgi:iron complex outermembrane receptor protein
MVFGMKPRSNQRACSVCFRLWFAARTACGIGVLGLLVFASGARAQQSSDAKASIGESALEEIIVTADKRQENIQTVPISINVVRGSDLSGAGITSSSELAAVVPGLTMQTSLNGMNAHLRGVGTTAFAPGEENSIAFYLDGVFMARLSGGFLNLSNIAQIEVDKGPQGTLFGRNATGGVISVTTKDPTQAVGGTTSVSYGNYNTVATDDYITGGITRNLAADLAVHYSNQGDGYGKNLNSGEDVNKSQDFAARSKWLFTPTDLDRVTVALDYERTVSSVFGGQSPLPQYPTNWGPGAPAPTGQPFLFTGSPWDTDTVTEPRYRYQQGGASLNVEHDFGVARVTDIVAYRQDAKYTNWSVEPIPTTAESAYWDVGDHQTTEELQVASPIKSLVQWVGGLYLMDATTVMSPLVASGSAATPAPLNAVVFSSTETTRSAALFGQATTPIPMVPDTNLTAGLRYTYERRGIEGDEVLQFDPPLPSVIKDPTNAHANFDKLTWRFALDHRFNDDLLAYISDNRGYKSGLFGTIPASSKPVQPEVIDAYEIGLKSEFLDHRLRLNSSFFYYDYSQLQVSTINRTSIVLQNAASAQIYGLDLDLEMKIGGHLTLTAGVEALRDKFTSFSDAEFFVPQTLAQGGGNALVVGNAAGNELPYTPSYSANLGFNYEIPTAYGQLDLSANYSYVSTWAPNADNILRSPVSNLINAKLDWRLPDDRTQIALWVKNLNNQAVPMFMESGANPGGYNEQITQPPRTFGVTVQYRF